MQQKWLNKNDIIENIEVEKLVFGWQWFARLKHENPDLDWRVVFITGWAIPWSVVNLRILKKRSAYFETQIVDIVKKSPLEKTHPTNIYWESWGWKWINIPYEEQLKIKENQIRESMHLIEKLQENIHFLPIEASPIIDWYRNKVEFSFGKYLSKKDNIEEHFNLGFHKQWEFSKVEDYDWAPLIDDIQNEVFLEIKKFTKTIWLPVYDQMRAEWFFRHLLIRKTHFTNEMMILLSFSPEYFEKNTRLNKEEKLSIIKDFFVKLAWKYPIIKSVYYSHNVNKSDTFIWDLELIYGKPTITERLLGLDFNISPTSFFQTNSTWAEKLYEMVLDFAKKDDLKNQIVLDLYGWTWTIGMIFAKAWAKNVKSVEMVTSASLDWKENAKLNWLHNIDFVNAKVEDFLAEYISSWEKADLLIIDPPRAWMHPGALPNILSFNTKQIIYVSCNPATLARDLEYILKNSNYEIEKIKPKDMFPHTHHIETIVSLIKKD